MGIQTYGHGRTRHETQHVEVEVDKNGKVVAVWFRCMTLAFKQVDVSDTRAQSMAKAYEQVGGVKLLAIQYEDMS